MRLAVTLLCVGTLGLAGCGEAMLSNNAPAMSAAECDAQYQAAKSRQSGNYAVPANAGAVVAFAAAKGAMAGALESAYDQCLARVGSQSGPAQTVQGAGYADVPGSSQCVRGSNTMQGGAGYCVGY